MERVSALVSVGRYAPREMMGLVVRQVTVGFQDLVIISEQPPAPLLPTVRWESSDGASGGEEQALPSDFKWAWRLGRELAKTTFISYAEYVSTVQKLMFTLIRSCGSLQEYVDSRDLHREIERWRNSV